jgi:hypothetical protein
VLKKTVTTDSPSEKVEQEEGDGIFSSLGMLAKSGIDLFAKNKELISNRKTDTKCKRKVSGKHL